MARNMHKVSPSQAIALAEGEGFGSMSIVKLLGFETLGCGCVVGHYREAGTIRVVTYVEEKATGCEEPTHQRNHATGARRRRTSGAAAPAAEPASAWRASSAR